MKIAIVSDIHGNLEALNAVLQNADLEKCEMIFCLGDIAMAGPQPIETIEKIKNLIDKNLLISIQGNTDEMICAFDKNQVADLKKSNPVMGNALEDDKKLIPDEFKTFLCSLPQTKELLIDGVEICLAHGSPRKNNENIFPDLPLEKVEEMIATTKADVIFVGHTHIPCGYQTNTNQTVVNTGSVGRPFTERPDACYAILETTPERTFTVKHNFVKYNKEKSAKLLEKRTFEGADKLAKMLMQPTERYPR